MCCMNVVYWEFLCENSVLTVSNVGFQGVGVHNLFTLRENQNSNPKFLLPTRVPVYCCSLTSRFTIFLNTQSQEEHVTFT